MRIGYCAWWAPFDEWGTDLEYPAQEAPPRARGFSISVCVYRAVVVNISGSMGCKGGLGGADGLFLAAEGEICLALL